MQQKILITAKAAEKIMNGIREGGQWAISKKRKHEEVGSKQETIITLGTLGTLNFRHLT
ncbi:unnamed protein product [marine sediment metagenome]|uniref:Uncharacterized protein n=1 Tax=marine sediment metagenome TaxID=412755 RepID=X1J8M9_9ZZZZ